MTEVRLYQFAPALGLESGSPFCIKVQRALRLQGLDYQVTNVPFQQLAKRSPQTRKLPVLDIDGRTVVDSTEILAAIDAQAPGLIPEAVEARARDHLLEDWADESLYWFAVYQRWKIDAHFEAFAASAFRKVPIPVRWLIPGVARNMARQQLSKQGIGRLTPEEVTKRLAAHVEALGSLLKDRPFLIDDRIRSSDLSVFATMRVLADLEGPGARIRESEALWAWMLRVDAATRPPKSKELS